MCFGRAVAIWISVGSVFRSLAYSHEDPWVPPASELKRVATPPVTVALRLESFATIDGDGYQQLSTEEHKLPPPLQDQQERSSIQGTTPQMEDFKVVSPSFEEALVDPLGRGSLLLYHEIFRSAVRAMTKPTVHYVLTSAFLRSTTISNPILGSLFYALREKRMFLEQVEKAVRRKPHTNERQRKEEFEAVLKVLKQTSGASSERLHRDASIVTALRHLIFHIRDEKRNGLASAFQIMSSNSVFALAHSMLYVGTSLGFAFRNLLEKRLGLLKSCLRVTVMVQGIVRPTGLLPGGFLGIFFHTAMRMFNLILFPQLLSLTGALSVALGLACVLSVPAAFAAVYKSVRKTLARGVMAVFHSAQLFRLSNDPHGVKLLRESFRNRFPHMLTKLWQLGLHDSDIFDQSALGVHAISEKGGWILSGVVDFAKEYASFIETEYITAYEKEMTKCYAQNVLLLKTKLICEETYRRTERFAARSGAVINFESWQSFRNAVADMLLMIYDSARITLEAKAAGDEQSSVNGLRAAFRNASLAETFESRAILRPIVRRDVHRITSGIVDFVTFLELRKLHKWTPQSSGSAVNPRSTPKTDRSSSKPPERRNESDVVSLVDQRFEAFADVDLPPMLATAAPTLTKVDDLSVSLAESVLLKKYASKRDMLMMSLLRKSVQKLVLAFKGIFGMLTNLVQGSSNHDRIHPCKLGSRGVCFDASEASKTKETVLHVLLSAHLGVFMGREGKVTGSKKDLQQDFISLIKHAAWFRFQPRFPLPRLKSSWGLDILMDYLFPERKGSEQSKDPITNEQLTVIEKAVASIQAAASKRLENLFKLKRIQCVKEGSLLVLTTDMGDSKVFRPDSAISPEVHKRLCTYEHELISVSGWYRLKDVGGQLVVPGIAEIDGFVTESAAILSSKEEDDNIGHLIEAVLWSKGIQRIDARMASELIVYTKRLLYSEQSWEDFFAEVSPADMDYVQQAVLSGGGQEDVKYLEGENRDWFSVNMKADKLVNVLASALQTTLIAGGSLRAGLQDLALISGGSFVLHAIDIAEATVPAMRASLTRFQKTLWDQFAARKQCAASKSLSTHIPDLKHRQTSGRKAQLPISDAFARKEGRFQVVFEDWCEEIYRNASTRPVEQAKANLSAEDSGVIQCSLLLFLGKRQVERPTAREKRAVFRYLEHVTEQLRRSKKTNRYSWKTYLNARPKTVGRVREESKSVRSAIKRSFVNLRKRVKEKSRLLLHAVRGGASKIIFGRRAFNILNEDEFLKALHLAAVEAFDDQSLFPKSVLVHPTTLEGFSRLHTILQFEVQPIINRNEAMDIVTHMKMTPEASPATKRLIEKLTSQLTEIRQSRGEQFRQHVRQRAGYLSLLYTVKALPDHIGPQIASVFYQFAMLMDQNTYVDRQQYIRAERELGFVEQAGIKLILKADEAIKLLEESIRELGEHPTLQPLGLMSRSLPGCLSPADGGQEPPHLRLGRLSMMMFCKLVIPTIPAPQHKKLRDAGIEHLKELIVILTNSQFSPYFQADADGSAAALEFHSLESLVKAMEDLKVDEESQQASKLTAAFLLHVPLIKALEIIGLSTERVGNGVKASPLQCTPEDNISGSWYTTPVNARSRLRMLSSILLHLADAEDVVEALETSSMTEESSSPLTSVQFDKVGDTQSFQESAVGGPKVENYRTSSTGPGIVQSSVHERASLVQLKGTRESENQYDVTKEVNLTSMHNLESAADLPSNSENRTSELKEKSAQSALQESLYVEEKSLQHAKATMIHIRQQISMFDIHASEFAFNFHTLLSIAQLPTALYSSITSRFLDSLSLVAVGERRGVEKWWSIEQLRRNSSADSTLEKTANSNENGKTDSFNTVFLPKSVENMVANIRTEWKRLLRTDILSVHSSACKQNASLLENSDIEAYEKRGDRAEALTAMLPDASGTAAPAGTGTPGRAELCIHPLLLDLRARITLETQMLEKEELFPYFIRMGIANVHLVHKTAKQALLDCLWDKLAAMGWLNADPTSKTVLTARVEVRKAISSISKRHSLLLVDNVRVLVEEFLHNLLGTPELTKEALQNFLELLQKNAVERAAAFLFSSASEIEWERAENAVRELTAPVPASLPAGAEKCTEQRQPDLKAFLPQAYFASDPLMLLSRQAIFTPAVVVLDILNRVTSPKSRIVALWNKTLKTTRQLTRESLALAMSVPRAYAYRRSQKRRY